MANIRFSPAVVPTTTSPVTKVKGDPSSASQSKPVRPSPVYASSKLTREHLERFVILDVRQSTGQQLRDHQESTTIARQPLEGRSQVEPIERKSFHDDESPIFFRLPVKTAKLCSKPGLTFRDVSGADMFYA